MKEHGQSASKTVRDIFITPWTSHPHVFLKDTYCSVVVLHQVKDVDCYLLALITPVLLWEYGVQHGKMLPLHFALAFYFTEGWYM